MNEIKDQLHDQPPKRPVTKEPLRFGIDIDGTISQAPKHFKRLIDAMLMLGNEVYIITGRREYIRPQTESLLLDFEINYTDLIMRPDDWERSVAEFKVKAVDEKEVHMMFDNEEENCWAIQQQTPALAAHMLPIPEMPEAHEARMKYDHHGQ
jgi:uncharacterized HAD superfamily protein